jgi:hypothetical protein
VIYRDDRAAARERTLQLVERVAALERELTPERWKCLPPKLSKRLRELMHQARSGAPPDNCEAQLAALGALIALALERAPALDAEWNRLALHAPDRRALRWNSRPFDGRDSRNAALRAAVHQEIARRDPEAVVHDRVGGAGRHADREYLVDASFRADSAPIRVHVATHSLPRANALVARVGLFTHVRSSMAAFALVPAPSASTEATFERAFAVRGDGPGLIGDGRRALLTLKAAAEELLLEVDDGCARLELTLRGASLAPRAVSAVGHAVAVLTALRRTPPTTPARRSHG